MDNEWDTEETFEHGDVVKSGRTFGGKGRGFVARDDDNNSSGSSSNYNNNSRGYHKDRGNQNTKDTWGNNEDDWGDTHGGDSWKDNNEGRSRNKYNNNSRGNRSDRGNKHTRGGWDNNDDESGDTKQGDSWDDNKESNGYGLSNNDYDNDDGDHHSSGRGGRRGGGRGGGRGRGGERGDRRGARDGFDEGRGSRDGFGDRGGRRGGRDGFTDRGKSSNDNDDGQEKKREIYTPPEKSTDENDIFHSGNTTGINFTKYDSIEVKTTGENVPPPITTFESACLKELLLKNIIKSNYTKPTPIQKHSLPIILGGRDLMACAQTGSGKTAAFLVPIIQELLNSQAELVMDGNHVEPQCIIISPTRELASQIYDEAFKFAFKSILKICLVYGGTSIRYQLDRIMKGCNILVATPGRMKDFVQRGHITFNSVRFVVLDEADRMLDMGFIGDVEEIMEHSSMVPTGERQTLMFSATFPEEIQHLAGKFLNNYIFVAVGVVGGACTDVEQVFHEVPKFKKREKLVEILREDGTERTLIFVETKRNADFLASFLSENNFPTTSIHGDRYQREREEALRDFKRGNRHILVATSVAARGLDIKDVKHVINFDLPKSIDEYVHRIGRTGRVGNRGKATSFFDETQDKEIAPALVRILKQADQNVPGWLGSESGSIFHDNSGFGGVDYRDGNFGNDEPIRPYEPEEAW